MVKWLVSLGLVLVAAGLLWPMILTGPGRLLEDMLVRRDGFGFPATLCLVVSLVISIIIWIFRR